MTSILILGGASWNRMVHVDALPQGNNATITQARETYVAGSTGLGKAMALAALGYQPVLHAAIGEDAHGRSIQEVCKTRGIQLIADIQPEPTPHHLNIMDKAGGRFSIFVSSEPEDPHLDEPRLKAAIMAAETIFISLSNATRKALPMLKHAKAETLLDLHDYDGANPWHTPFIAQADCIQLSDVALQSSEQTIHSLLAGRARQVILTKGEFGATHFRTEGPTAVPAIPAKPRDANGAGDAFSVGFWYGQKQGMSVRDAGKIAAAMAAFAIESDQLFPEEIKTPDILRRAGLT